MAAPVVDRCRDLDDLCHFLDEVEGQALSHATMTATEEDPAEVRGSPPALDPLSSPLMRRASDYWWADLLKREWPPSLKFGRGPVTVISACTGTSAESAVFEAGVFQSFAHVCFACRDVQSSTWQQLAATNFIQVAAIAAS